MALVSFQERDIGRWTRSGCIIDRGEREAPQARTDDPSPSARPGTTTSSATRWCDECRRGIVFERIDGVSLLKYTQARPWTIFGAVRLLAELHAQIHCCTARPRKFS
jgi:hypothetical protein